MNLISITDFTKEEVNGLIKLTAKIKRSPGRYSGKLKGRIAAMLFEKQSTRTRVSFEVAMLQTGGNCIFLNTQDTQLGRGEAVADSARVLGRYVDCIIARVKNHANLFELAGKSGKPVINALSDVEHPCQAISDLFSMYEELGSLKGKKIAYLGDGNNVCNSLLLGSAMVGMNITIATPEKYRPPKEIVAKGKRIAKEVGASVELTPDPYDAVKNADILYTDVWVSMGYEDETKERLKDLKKYQINDNLLKAAKKNCKVMHCLPAHRGLEITDNVIDGKNSIVFDQAENRLHAQKAILMKLLG